MLLQLLFSFEFSKGYHGNERNEKNISSSRKYCLNNREGNGRPGAGVLGGVGVHWELDRKYALVVWDQRVLLEFAVVAS